MSTSLGYVLAVMFEVCAFGLDEVCAFGLDKFLNWLIWRHRLSESVYKSNIFSKAVCRLNKGF